MNARRTLVIVAWLAVMAAPARTIDLEKIDRSIVKQPAYESKHPQYCLLVFEFRGHELILAV
jgi:hypothetical protein